MASDNLYRKYDRRMTDLVGQRFYLFGDTTKTLPGSGCCTGQNVRYHDYDQARSSYSMMVKQSFYYIGLELCVRVREGQDNDFIERLKADSESQFRIGNIFISEIRSFKDIRRNYQQAWTNDIRNYVMGMGFLLLNNFPRLARNILVPYAATPFGDSTAQSAWSDRPCHLQPAA